MALNFENAWQELAAHTDGEVIAALGRMLDSASPDAFGGRKHEAEAAREALVCGGGGGDFSGQFKDEHEAEAAREALVSICRSLPLFQRET